VLGVLAFAPSTAAGSASTAGGGGGVYVAKPKITKVSCLRECASRKRARAGSTLRIQGRALGEASEVVFLGSTGRRDNAAENVRPSSDSRVQVEVPMAAVTGPVEVVTSAGARSRTTAPVPILPATEPTPNPTLSPVPGTGVAGAPQLETGTSRTKAYVGSRRGVKFSYRLSGVAPASVSIELVSATTGAAVKTWTPTAATPGVVQTISWRGRVGRSAAPTGRYSFRLTAAGANGARASSSQANGFDRDSFDLYDHVFPVRGRHDYGGSGARFGAGRSGHSHQGHDVMARCGTRLVAARGGRVQYQGYHAAAGNYIVIDGAGDSVDYVYMHLAEPSPLRSGDRVYTGQRIGAVGETGNAQGCHLHFEMWGPPGWYEGGDPFDPLRSLKAWDSWS
jgi:murein DD-endopeptidase MepM/ murein hydrolase activator NlpD